MDLEEAIARMKGQLIQLGMYSFRLSKAPHPKISQQIGALRQQIEADLKSLLHLRPKTLLSINSERLQHLVNNACNLYDASFGVLLTHVVEEAIRADLPFTPHGKFLYVRAGLVSLPELPMLEHSRPMSDEDVGRMHDWISSQVSDPVIEVFERIGFDSANDAFLFEIAYPREDGKAY